MTPAARAPAVLLALAVHLAPLAASAETVPTIDGAIALAKQQSKPLLIELSTSWCGPCKVFKKKILPEPKVQEALAGWIFVIYDAEVDPGREAQERYAAEGYPTFVAIDVDGSELGRQVGIGSAAEFVHFLAGVEGSFGGGASLDERLTADPDDPALLLRAARRSKSRGELNEALALYDRAALLGGDGGAAADAAWEAAGVRRIQDRGRRALDDALAYVRAYPSSPHTARALELVALAKRIEGDDLTQLLTIQIGVSSDDPRALLALALLARNLDRPELARQAGATLARLDPDDEDAAALAAGKTNANLDRRAKAMLYAGDAALDDVEGHRYERLYGADVPSRRAHDPEIDKLLDGWRMQESAFERVSERCGDLARGFDEAWVRVVVPAAGGKPSDVIVMEPDLPPALSKCIETELAAAAFPPPRKGEEVRITDAVRFQDRAGVRAKARRKLATQGRVRLIGFGGGMFGDEGIGLVGASIEMIGGALAIGFDGAIGGAGDDRSAGWVSAVIGGGFRRDSVHVSLRAGVSYDWIQGVVPAGVTIPIEAHVFVDDRAGGWLRLAAAADDARKDGSPTGFLDELGAGLMVRVRGRVWAGGMIREQVGERFFGVFLGYGGEEHSGR